jgi:hypothetical protein
MLLSVTISAAAQDRSLPIPDGARKNASLGGATTLATGKNYHDQVVRPSTRPLRPSASSMPHNCLARSETAEGAKK